MKKIKFILLAALACFACTFMYAQVVPDSTIVHLAQGGIAYAASRYPLLAKIVGFIAVADTIIGLIPDSIWPAGGVAHQIKLWMVAIFGTKKI